MVLVIWLIFVNLAAFILYGADKSFAKKGARRISEKSLLFLAWIGGSIGAFLAMQIFRHKTRKPKFYAVPALMVLEIVICCFCLYQNYNLGTTEYMADLGLGKEITVVQVSDLHNQFFGPGESVLLEKIEEASPDIIVVTGDVVDKFHTNYGMALDFFEEAVKTAPVYYVTGNHEAWLEGEKINEMYGKMRDLGVNFLDDSYIDMGEYILAGIADESLDYFKAYEPFDDSKPVIMLAHEPQYSPMYKGLGADLVFTGHYHGGQIIIPGVGGVMSPEFEFFPELYEGIHDIDGMKIIISRGLGNSLAPVRINNYPELVIAKVS